MLKIRHIAKPKNVGKKVFEKSAENSHQINLNLAFIPKRVYLIQLTDKLGNIVKQQKITKQMKLIVSFLFSIFFYISAFSQTTEEEYNYVTKGYKIQIESGLDMKKGYRFEEIAEHYTTNNTNAKRTCKFLALYRLGELKPCAK